MESNQKRELKGFPPDSVLVEFTAEMLSPDSPEFQARASRPASERGPNLALYRELQNDKNTEAQPPQE